jgi:hypothetical protein
MKVLDYSPIPFDGGKLSFPERLKGIFRFGFNWVPDMKSQEVFIGMLNRVLVKRFTLLRNVPLPGGGVTIPLVLLGPHGITVMYNSPLRGVFRATGGSWEVMDNRLRNFKPTKPNLITRTLLMTKAFETFLGGCGYALEMDGILVFTDPGLHVNADRPDVRIILMDAIERLGAQLLQTEQVLSMEDVSAIIDSITDALQPEDETDEDNRVVPYEPFVQSVDSGFLQAIEPLQKKFNFSQRQWILLWAFAIVDVLVLIGFVIFILLTA